MITAEVTVESNNEENSKSLVPGTQLPVPAHYFLLMDHEVRNINHRRRNKLSGRPKFTNTADCDPSPWPHREHTPFWVGQKANIIVTLVEIMITFCILRNVIGILISVSLLGGPKC
jgi:hypothetical protein